MHKTKRLTIVLLVVAMMIFALALSACAQTVSPAETAKKLIDQLFDTETETAYTVTATLTWTETESDSGGTSIKTSKQDCTVLVKGNQIHGKYVMNNGTPVYNGIVSVGKMYYTYEYTGDDGANAEFREVEKDSLDFYVEELCPVVPILPFFKKTFPDCFEEKDGVFVLKEENYIDLYRFLSGDADVTEIPEEIVGELKNIAQMLSLEVGKNSLILRQNVGKGSVTAAISDVGTTDFKSFHPLTLPSEPDTPSADAAATMAYLAGSNANFTYAANALISSNGEGQEYKRISGDQYHSKYVMGSQTEYAGRFRKDNVTYEYHGEENNIRLKNIWGSPAGEDSLYSMFLRPILESFDLFALAEDGIYRLPEENYLAMYNRILEENEITVPEEYLSMLESYRIAFSETSVSFSFRMEIYMEIYYADFTITDIGTTVFEPYTELPEPTYRPHSSEIVRSFAEGNINYYVEYHSDNTHVSGSVLSNRAYIVQKGNGRNWGIYRDGTSHYTFESSEFTPISAERYAELFEEYDFQKLLRAMVEGIRREILVLESSGTFNLVQGAESEFYKLFCGNSQPDPNVDPTELFRNFRFDIYSDGAHVSTSFADRHIGFYEAGDSDFHPPFTPPSQIRALQ